MKIRFNAVQNHGAERFFWKMVETQPNNLSLEHRLKGIWAFARLLPVHSGLLQLVQKACHKSYFSPLARRNSIFRMTSGLVRFTASRALS
jgi:hypothetical protein